MIGKNFLINSVPVFQDVYCPKDGSSLIELDNGWFSTCWYCEKCKYPYELEMRKMLKVNQEGLKSALEKYNKKIKN